METRLHEVIQSIGDPNKTRIKREFLRPFHPDRAPNQTETFQALQNFFDICKSPHENLAPETHNIQYNLSARSVDDHIRISQTVCTMGIKHVPSTPGAAPTPFHRAVKVVFDLSDDDLNQINTKYTNLLSAHINSLVEHSSQRGMVDRIMNSHHPIENDCAVLTNHTHDAALQNSLQVLQNQKITYNHFADDANRFIHMSMTFNVQYFDDPDCANNLFKLYILMILRHKTHIEIEEPSYFSKQAMAEALLFCLKAPIFCISFLCTALFLAYLTLVPYVLFLTMLLNPSLAVILLSCAYLLTVLPLITEFLTLDDIFDGITNIGSDLASGCDALIAKAFGVNFLITAVAQILQEYNEQYGLHAEPAAPAAAAAVVVVEEERPNRGFMLGFGNE